MTNEKLNLQPLQELLEKEVPLEELIQHLDHVYHYFSENSMKVSNWDSQPVDEQEVICLYWIGRVKRLFEEVKN